MCICVRVCLVERECTCICACFMRVCYVVHIVGIPCLIFSTHAFSLSLLFTLSLFLFLFLSLSLSLSLLLSLFSLSLALPFNHTHTQTHTHTHIHTRTHTHKQIERGVYRRSRKKSHTGCCSKQIYAYVCLMCVRVCACA